MWWWWWCLMDVIFVILSFSECNQTFNTRSIFFQNIPTTTLPPPTKPAVRGHVTHTSEDYVESYCSVLLSNVSLPNLRINAMMLLLSLRGSGE